MKKKKKKPSHQSFENLHIYFLFHNIIQHLKIERELTKLKTFAYQLLPSIFSINSSSTNLIFMIILSLSFSLFLISRWLFSSPLSFSISFILSDFCLTTTSFLFFSFFFYVSFFFFPKEKAVSYICLSFFFYFFIIFLENSIFSLVLKNTWVCL